MDYKTRDIVCAATMLIFDAQLKNIEIEPGTRRGTFVLTNVLEEDLDQFNLGNLLVEPVRFNAQVRFLSSAISKLIEKRS
jgi:hypothetical protein